MPRFRSIRSRRSRNKITTDFDLQLTSMMDILIVVLVFLLKSFSVATHSFTSVNNLEMPVSRSANLPPDSLHLIISKDAMIFENERVVDFVKSASSLGDDRASNRLNRSDLDDQGRRILPLFQALIKAKESAEVLRMKSPARDDQGNPLPFEGVLAIQADKQINYTVLRKVMYTAGTAGYRIFRFLAMRDDSADNVK